MFGFKKNKTTEVTNEDSSLTLSKIIIDVRDISEIEETGKIKGAKHIPLMDLSNVADINYPDYDPDLALDAEIEVYCASGGRSSQAAQLLNDLGYSNVTNLGGFNTAIMTGAEIEFV